MQNTNALMLVAALGTWAAACSSAHNHPLTQGQLLRKQAPVVEAFLEYVGPPDKWAGPASFVVHVTARELSHPEVALYPSHLAHPVAPSGRAVASANGEMKLTGATARDQLAELAGLMGQEQSWYGCLYPVRVRLIREDGSLTDKYGCRGQDGWPAAMTRILGQFIQVAQAQHIDAPRAVEPAAPQPLGPPAPHVASL
jgi:hypothetical protein